MLRLWRDHLANGFLLLWLILVYLWQFLLLFNTTSFVITLVISSILFTFHVLLYGVGIAYARQRYQQFLVLLGLTGSIIFLSFFERNFDIMLGLYLALFVEAFHLLGQTRLTMLFILACLLLYGVNLRLIHVGFGFGLNLLPPLLFIGSYIGLHAQQIDAHARTQSLLDELEITHTSLQTAHAQLAAYALQVESLTREAERQRLARELHDTHAQGLVGLILQLEAINSHLAQQHYEQVTTLVTQAIQRARSTLLAARQAIDDLRANGISPSDLSEAVQEEIDRFVTTTGIPCEAEITALSFMPVPLCEYTLRAVTEGLTNITRHAQAQRAWVHTAISEGEITIEIGDNGNGCDPLAVEQLVGHYGLLGLRERTHFVQGKFDMMSKPGEGTLLRFTLPMK